jgi:hypothetical protein
LRKLLIGAVAASATLAIAAGAIAQTPESTFTAKVSPKDAGTTKNPKNTTLQFGVTLNRPGTTVEFIDLALPRGLKLSGKGLKHCSVDTLAAEGPSGCPSVFYVASETGAGIAVQSPITGEITSKGRKLRIRIPQELRQPVAGVDASLTSLNQTFKGKIGKKYVVSSTGCKNKKHKFTGKLTFTTRADGAPVPPPVPLATSAKCSK